MLDKYACLAKIAARRSASTARSAATSKVWP